MDNVVWTLLAILASLFAIFYVEYRRIYNYWTKKRVAFPLYQCFYGSSLIPILTKTPPHESWLKLYNLFPNDKIVGLFSMVRPIILIKDPNLLEKIMVKDFHHFVDHDSPKVDKSTILNQGLFNLTGNEWRSYRGKISPTFTTGKLKTMFDEMIQCGDALVERLGKAENINHNIKDDIITYAMDVSAVVVFGIELKNEMLRKEYKRVSAEMFKIGHLKRFILIFMSQFPKLGAKLGFKFLNEEHENFFRDIIKQTFKQRSENNVQRNDYVQLLLKLKEKGHLDVKTKDLDDEYLKSDDTTTTENFEVTDDILAAQAFQFLTAGLEPIYNTMLLALLEIAQNKEIQEKLRNEIKENKAKHGGYNYTTLRDMTYMEQCIHETLRKYPVLPFLMRICAKDYPVNEYFTIEKGSQIIVSISGIHRDQAYYPNPEKFDPERFNSESMPKNFTYLPFGSGPRICVGMRFALMEMKFGIAKILENYNLTLGDKTKIPYELSPQSFFLSPVSPYINLEKIKVS